MASRQEIFNRRIQNKIDQFDIHARGVNYRPFLEVRDVPSTGRSAIELGLTTGRPHHIFSDLEHYYLVLSEYSTRVNDILEQYPLLPREETIAIAETLGIRHPVYPGTTVPVVMTTDQVAVVSDNGGEKFIPMSLKYASQLRPDPTGKDKRRSVEAIQRIIDKLLIEKIYWTCRNSPWQLCTDEMLPIMCVRNLDSLRTSMMAKESDWLNPRLNEFVTSLQALWLPNTVLKELYTELAELLSLNVPEITVLFGRSVWLRLLPVDLNSALIKCDSPLLMLPNREDA